MKFFISPLYGIVLLLIFSRCANPFNQKGYREVNNSYIKGVNFTNYSRHGYQSDASKASLQHYRTSGGEWITIIKTYYQETTSASHIFDDSLKTPSASAIDTIVLEAQQLGLKIGMVPHVDVRAGNWRGDISPHDVDAWFTQYISLIVIFAQQAQRLHVDLFSIGCEFKALSTKPQWHNVIDSVRHYYTGELTYCANWNEYQQISFWDNLDYVGIDWYVPLHTGQQSTLEQEQSTLELFVTELGRWAGTRKILLTEIGFPSQHEATLTPWLAPTTGTKDWAMQAECYRMILETFPHRPWFAGLFWWEWEAERYEPEYPRNFNPAGKNAEEVLHEFWR